jgi:alpha-ribazole phosphatase
MEVYFIRHTTPDVPRGTSYGHSDVPLKASFPEELDTVRAKLETIPRFDRYFSSPLSRCTRLAEGLGGMPPHVDRRLIEIDFGDWEMRFWDGDTLAVLKSVIATPAPNGESYLQVQERVLSFLDNLARQEFERVAVVTHAGVIRGAIAHVLSMPLDRLFTLVPSLGGVTCFDIHGNDRRLLFFNR